MNRSPWWGLSGAALLALAAALVATWLEFAERLHLASRRWEHLQLDEWLVALWVFAASLVVLYARRHAQLQAAMADNRRLRRATLALQEDERRHLARELHDELGQVLNALRLEALALEELPGPAGEAGLRIGAQSAQAYAAVRDLMHRLRPAALDELGLVAALEACMDVWRRAAPALQLRLSVAGELEGLDEAVNLAIYRLVQEALTNALRHARATRVEIDLTRGPAAAEVLLEIRDDGVGVPDGRPPTCGFGIAGMRERIELLGGRFSWQGRPGAGVTVRAEIPLDAATHPAEARP
ncbi:MAG: hypothetical protein RL026_91 [Pseudomonadota bacterium]